MADLREFQLAAVERIVEKLSDPRGSRRFLLADEVGLGKTLVAKGVVDQLRSRKTAGGFTLVYICSNNEIADQNREKLSDVKDNVIPGRLTLLALQSQQIIRGRENGRLQVFAFTPGTSLQVERGTGIAKERRLLLYLVFRVWRKRINKRKWREFFRCSAGEERWHQITRFRPLRREFFRSIAIDLQSRLKDQWNSQKIHLLNPDTGLPDPRSWRLADCIDECVDAFAYNPRGTEFHRKNRNVIIGELRKGLARVSLEFLEPQLIILDEFQRFSDILLESDREDSIVGKLFRRGSGAILVLSATPYKMYTLTHEDEDHEKEFLKTLGFLRKESIEGPSVIDIKNDLRAFRERLLLGEWAIADDPELFELRGRIEARLKEVMCRTERNWYLEDAAKGVMEISSGGVSPQKSELIEYIHLRNFLLKHKVGDWNITDFWKSSPSVLSFMDSQYGLTNRIRRNHLSLPPTMLRPNAELSAMAKDNAKFRLFFEKVFGGGTSEYLASGWKYLWVRPTYTYYEDTFYKDFEPTKFLVFSHWRFVPKAVSVLTSHEALKYIPRTRHRIRSSPLQFRTKLAFYSFDVCYPSLALANCVDHLQLGRSAAVSLTSKQLFARARREIELLLKNFGVRRGKVRTAPLWKIMAYVEARSTFAAEIRSGLIRTQHANSSETPEYLSKHATEYLSWMRDDSPLSISPVWLNRLTEIALHSPAVSLLRSYMSLFPDQAEKAWADVLDFCLGPLRLYFNKPLVQTIIRRHGSGRSYVQQIMSYCRQAHFQAVIDEYGYLVRNVLQEHDEKQFLEHLGRAMGMWSGSPGMNERTRLGYVSRRPQQKPAHFALAFGEDVSNESTEREGKARKSAVREAFNSPFWPFVLATTSVGQEGLDFHLYCRDIVHWNLPSNPVDLEQREGRINRYQGLSIRHNIRNDFPLEMVRPETGENLWNSVFRVVGGKSSDNGRFKNGLFPHWIYQSQFVRESADGPDSSIIRRHLLFYTGSKDRKRYSELKNALALYRLVFGQPRQQDILEQIFAQRQAPDPAELSRYLAKYMINVSPFGPDHAIRRAELEAERLLSEPEALRDLLQSVPKHLCKIPRETLEQIRAQLEDLILLASVPEAYIDDTRRASALAAILYLLDPYDAVHDRHGVFGHSDDVTIIAEAHSKLQGEIALKRNGLSRLS
jgi:uncharacterized membrane protein YkvA (DUF1232 family)